jgi:hypothetical protein
VQQQQLAVAGALSSTPAGQQHLLSNSLIALPPFCKLNTPPPDVPAYTVQALTAAALLLLLLLLLLAALPPRQGGAV